jgi:hypothetical protein
VTARDFGVKQAKVILALRRDLIERVFRLTRESGFQEEKYQSSYLPVVWSKEELLELLDARLQALVSRRYTKTKVSHVDLLPKMFAGKSISDYVCETAPRPRDIIAFFNSCIATATDAARLAPSQLKLAEGEYSRSRLRALGDEWSAEFPSLLDFAKILYQKPSSFKLSSIRDSDAEELCLTSAISLENVLVKEIRSFGVDNDTYIRGDLGLRDLPAVRIDPRFCFMRL